MSSIPAIFVWVGGITMGFGKFTDTLLQVLGHIFCNCSGNELGE